MVVLTECFMRTCIKSLLCSLKISFPTGLSEGDSGRRVSHPSILGGQLYSKKAQHKILQNKTHLE